MDETIAYYRERLLDRSRELTLDGDRIIIRGKRFPGRRFEQTVRLYTLDPKYVRMWVRGCGFREGWRMLIVGAIGLALVLWYFGLSGIAAPPKGTFWAPGLFLFTGAFCFAIGGAILCLTERRIEVAHFSGRVPLRIFRSGPDESSFDEFVAAVAEQVQKWRIEAR